MPQTLDAWYRRCAPLLLLVALLAQPSAARAQSSSGGPSVRLSFAPPELTLSDAITWALENNPELATFRQQRGVAAADAVIARTYPHNPVVTAQPTYVHSPQGQTVTNHAPYQIAVTVPIEIRHQRRFRQEEALAGLSRTEWEILEREMFVSVRVARAFWGALYRAEKLKLLEATSRLNEHGAEQVKRLVEQGKLRGGDLILARAEVDDAQALLHAARTTQAVAQADLLRSMGLVDHTAILLGEMDVSSSLGDVEALTRSALARRPDLQARQSAAAEASARLRLTIADRFGNPVVGPYYQNDQDRLQFIGGQISVPLPVFNTQRGEIQKREAELQIALFSVRQAEIQIRQDVLAATTRLQSATAAVDAYRKKILPNLREGLASMERLFAAGEPGVDVLRLIDLRRRVLRVSDGYLDALWEASQARADLAAAVGDPAVFSGPLPENAPRP
jgi:cobalt-zinc-cadmium efflux system outer membrane protein